MTEIWNRDTYQNFIAKRRSKYNARPTTIDGWRFQSKAEAEYYHYNTVRITAGELLYQLRQVPFHLPGKLVYRVDFMECYPDGRLRYVDVKGMETKEFKMKKRLVEDLFPVRIERVKRIKGGFVNIDNQGGNEG